MKFTFYGHASFGVEINGSHILFDPFISPNEKAAHIDVNSLECDFLLLSHGHGDHIADAIPIATRTGAKVVSNFEIVNWAQSNGIENAHPMNHGGKWKFDFGTVKMVNAIHTSSFPDGSYAGNPAGFVIESEAGNFYFAGDTALTLDMELIGRYHSLDFAVLPIGDNFTMGVDDAVIAAGMVKADKIIGVHYDTFGYIVVDHKEAKQKFAEAGKELILLEIGESIEI